MSRAAPQRSLILTEDMKRACDLGRTEEAVRAQWWSHYARLAHRSPGTAAGYHDADRSLPE